MAWDFGLIKGGIQQTSVQGVIAIQPYVSTEFL